MQHDLQVIKSNLRHFLGIGFDRKPTLNEIQFKMCWLVNLKLQRNIVLKIS